MNEVVTTLDIPTTWAHCSRCRDALPTNHGRLCYDCRRDIRQRAESYGGEMIEVEGRYQGYLREWDD